MKTLLTVGIPLLAILLIVLIIVFLKRSQGLKGILKAEEKAREIIARAEQEAEKIKRQVIWRLR